MLFRFIYLHLFSACIFSMLYFYSIFICFAWADAEGGGGDKRVQTTPLKNHKNMGFLINNGPDPLKNHLVTKPVFNVGPSPVGR